MGCLIHIYRKWKNGYGKVVLKVCKRCGEMLFLQYYESKFSLGGGHDSWFICKDVEKRCLERKKIKPVKEKEDKGGKGIDIGKLIMEKCNEEV